MFYHSTIVISFHTSNFLLSIFSSFLLISLIYEISKDVSVKKHTQNNVLFDNLFYLTSLFGKKFNFDKKKSMKIENFIKEMR